MILQIVSFIFWLFVIPICCGISITRGIQEEEQNFAMILVTGYFIMLAVFQSVYLIFVIFYNHFEALAVTYEGVMLIGTAVSLIINGKYFIFKKRAKKKLAFGTCILWGIVLFLIGFQCYKSVFYQFHDGDDAFYAVTSVITNTNNNMYVNLPYTGETSVLDKRHAFSSAPIFISFLARVSKTHPSIVTYTVFPIFILILVYMLYKLVADILLEQNRKYVPLFLIIVNIMNLFGNDTIYMKSTFLLTRTSQGKAFLANVIPVAAILCLLLIGKTIEKDNNVKENKEEKSSRNPAPWILLSCVMIAAGYSSIMGIFLVVILVGIGGLLLSIAYRKISLLVPCMLTMLPLFVFGLLYLKVLLEL